MEDLQTKNLKSGEILEQTYDFNSKWYAEKECKSFNDASLPPTEDGFFCPKCKNKRLIGIVDYVDGIYYQSTIPCECQERLKAEKNIKASGLKAVKELDTFKADEKWQEVIKLKAERFLQQTENRCYYVGGQTGAGKTHICSGIAWELAKKGKSLLYFSWADEASQLTTYSNESRFSRLEELAKVDLLYIDDFLKPHGDGYNRAEIGLAFDIIDRRYRDESKSTIISSELTIQKLVNVDQATAGRIVEMAGEFIANINADPKKNYRLKSFNMVTI